MLDGHVDVIQDLGRVADRGDEVVGHTLGLQVEDPDPAVVGPHDVGNAPQQPRQAPLALEVGAPDAGVLADEHDLADAALHELADLGEDLVLAARVVAAADVGDRAEGAEAVAAVGDLDVGAGTLDGAQHVAGKGRLAGRGRVGVLEAEHRADDGDDAVLLVGADERGDLGELLVEGLSVARGDAAAHDDGAPADAVGRRLGEVEGGLDRLGGGGREERAGVDDRDVAVGGVRGLLEARGEQQRPHAVGVDLVLGAAQGDEEDPGGCALLARGGVSGS